MKKITILSILFSLTIAGINAQNSNIQYYYSLGVKTGFGVKDFSILNSETHHGYNSKLYDAEFGKTSKAHSYGATFELGITFHEMINLGTGINYVRRMQEGMYQARSYCGCVCGFGTERILLVSNNMEIPLSLRVHLLKNKKLQPFFSSEMYWSKDFKNNSLESAPIGLNYLGYRLGAGISYDIGKNRILLNPSYSRSFKSLNEIEYKYKEIVVDVKWIRVIGK